MNLETRAIQLEKALRLLVESAERYTHDPSWWDNLQIDLDRAKTLLSQEEGTKCCADGYDIECNQGRDCPRRN